MSEYSVYDFAESLSIEGIGKADVKRVVAGWGEHGDCAEWIGGFVMEMTDSRYAYLTGWCDTTGWG